MIAAHTIVQETLWERLKGTQKGTQMDSPKVSNPQSVGIASVAG